MQGEGTAANEAERHAAGPPAMDPLRAAFEAHYERLVRLCSLLAGRREDAEDIVQEAFARLARDTGKLMSLPPEAVEPYLRRTAVNVWKNRWRRLRVEHQHRQTAGEVTGAEDRVGLSFEERDDVWRAVLMLPPRQRACLVLRYYEDLTERDTARALGCSVGTVKSQTSKALAQLRKEVGER
jgi:RNA polymerase sigma-70 factor (sigma-E family)